MTEAENEQLYFDSLEIREHVTGSRHCKHGLGFTYDFCPIVNAANQHTKLVEALTTIREQHRLKARRANFNDCGCKYCEAINTALNPKG